MTNQTPAIRARNAEIAAHQAAAAAGINAAAGAPGIDAESARRYAMETSAHTSRAIREQRVGQMARAEAAADAAEEAKAHAEIASGAV